MKDIFNIVRRGAIASFIGMMALSANAFPVSKYANSSVLSSGKWVKIAIPADGIYEITAEELQAMGFGDINNVRIYGNGGHMISEVLDGSAIDDITPVASQVINGKLCFYGQGPVEMSAVTGEQPRFTRTINAYSTMGYYFLTEGGSAVEVKNVSASEQRVGTNAVGYSFDYFYHEVDRFSFGHSGKDLLGEDVTRGGSFDFTLPQVAHNNIIVNIAAGGKTSNGDVTMNATITTGGKSSAITFNAGTATIAKPTKSYNYYNACSPVASVTTASLPHEGTIKLTFKPASGAALVQGNLDNIIISYMRNNVIDESEQAQMRMAFLQIDSNDRIVLPGASATTVAWCIDQPGMPVNYEMSETDNGYAFCPDASNKVSRWVAFDPAKQLMKIASYEAVDNQNIHGMETPDMVIITNKVFHEQAQRIVEMHKLVDDLKIVVIDQDQIFNEFSSGTPDAMAYRLMCKMFYDRNNTKFKYLLLMGEGSYDNRGLASVKKNRILTYQTDVSNNEDYSYPADDFFGFLDDNSGAKIATAMLRLGVGRIPSATEAEAASDVDKLIKYVLNPDYGPWRNNIFFSAETGDSDMHMAQAEGIIGVFKNTLNTKFEDNKVYVDMFPRAINETAIPAEADRTSSEARRHLIELLDRGMYYGTYIGHASYRELTHSRMWSSNEVNNVTYPHLPIFMSACCDVARYDSDLRGVCEHMFHAPNGGAIALLTSTREVYANSNDQLNQAWTKNLFGWTPDSNIPTLGIAYMKAKQSFGSTVSAPNKLKYVLLGDPAMQVAYPRPLFDITEVNGTPVSAGTKVTVTPLQKVTVKARVLTPSGNNVDINFNGDATLTIYDREKLLKNTTYNGKTVPINYPRDILVQVQGRVVDGIFTGVAVMPRYCRAMNDGSIIRVYAHQDDTDLMVNGQFDGLTIAEYNENIAEDDNEAPVVTSMYLNEESTFGDGAIVPANSTLYLTADDDLGINSQTLSVGNKMRLVLDGKTSFYQVGNFINVSNEGRHLDLAFPLNGLSEGEHSLTCTVHDVAGNSASRTISFIVGNSNDITLAVNELPATTEATITAASKFTTLPNVDLKVTDALGKLVWSTTTNSFPATWDLTDNTGKPVNGGIYKIYGSYNDGMNHGGTNVTSVLVVKPVK